MKPQVTDALTLFEDLDLCFPVSFVHVYSWSKAQSDIQNQSNSFDFMSDYLTFLKSS